MVQISCHIPNIIYFITIIIFYSLAGSNAAHCTVSHSWSPDSRYFLTAVLAPRMNVDNGFRVFKYNGTGPVVHHQQGEDPLYYAAWHPRDPQLYPNRGQSPKRTDGADAAAVAPAVAAAKPAPAPYRPPGSTGALSELLRREAAPVGKVKPAGEAAVQKKPVALPAPARRIPGMAPPGAAPAAKKPAAEKKTPPSQPAPAPAKPTSAAALAPAPVPAPAPAEAAETNPAARLKNLRKRVKQIQEIRAKLADEAGFKPNVDQLSKLASEPAVLAEIAELEAIVK